MTRQKTRDKYIQFLNSLRSKGVFTMTNEIQKNKADNGLPGLLVELGYISAPNGFNSTCRWISTKRINEKTLQEIIDAKAVRYPKKKKVLKKQTEIFATEITEEQAIEVLKASKNFEYEIYRVVREKKRI